MYVSNIVETIQGYRNNGYYEFEMEMSKESLKEKLTQLKNKFQFAYEYLGLNRMNNKLEIGRAHV